MFLYVSCCYFVSCCVSLCVGIVTVVRDSEVTCTHQPFTIRSSIACVSTAVFWTSKWVLRTARYLRLARVACHQVLPRVAESTTSCGGVGCSPASYGVVQSRTVRYRTVLCSHMYCVARRGTYPAAVYSVLQRIEKPYSVLRHSRALYEVVLGNTA